MAAHREKSFVHAFFKVSTLAISHLITLSLEKSLEKVLNFGSKNLYEPWLWSTLFCLLVYSLRGRHSKGKGKGIRAPHALARPNFPLPLLTPATQATQFMVPGWKVLFEGEWLFLGQSATQPFLVSSRKETFESSKISIIKPLIGPSLRSWRNSLLKPREQKRGLQNVTSPFSSRLRSSSAKTVLTLTIPPVVQANYSWYVSKHESILMVVKI